MLRVYMCIDLHQYCRSSAFRSLGIITGRRRKEVFRKAFSHWQVTISGCAHIQQQKDKITSASVITMAATHAKYRSFIAWRAQYKRNQIIYSFIRKLGSYDRKRTLRGALCTWRSGLRQGYQVRVVKTFARTLTRHGTVADCFKKWKYFFCDIYFPRKVMATKSIWRRCCRMRYLYLQAAFSRWSVDYTRNMARRQGMSRVVNDLRKYLTRVALRQWKDSIDKMDRKRTLLNRVFNVFSKKKVHMTICLSFSKWLQFLRSVDRDRHVRVMHENALRMQEAAEKHADEASNILTSHARDTHNTLQCVKLVIKAMKLISCGQRRRLRLLLAFRRWSLLSIVGNSVHSTSVVCYTHRIVMLMFGRLKEKRKVAFEKWKHKVVLINYQKKIIIRMQNSKHKNNVSSAFRKWKDVLWSLNLSTLDKKLRQMKVKECLTRWQCMRIAMPFQKWKSVSNFVKSRLLALCRVTKILKCSFLRMSFRRWHRSTVVHDLKERKGFLDKWQAAQLKTVQKFIENAFGKCQARILSRWKKFTKHSVAIKKAAETRTRLTNQKISKSWFSHWTAACRYRQRHRSGLRVLNALSASSYTAKMVKYFNMWTRASASATHHESISALKELEFKHHECMAQLQDSISKCNDANSAIAQLTQTLNIYQLSFQRDDQYKNTFMQHLANKKLLHFVYCRWKDRFVKYKSNSKIILRAVRHLHCRLDSYCLKQKFNLWKLKLSRAGLVVKVLGLFSHKWFYFQLQYAFRRWQHHSIQTYVAKLSETVRKKYSEMDDEVTFHQTENVKINMYIKFMNKWKDYVCSSLRRKTDLRRYIAYIANSKVLVAFQKWKHVNKCMAILANTLTKWVRVKMFAAFNSWKRIHAKIRKLDGTIRHFQKWQRHSMIELCRRWRSYCRFLKVQRVVLRSVMLTGNKRMSSRTHRAFFMWKDKFKSARILEHKEAYLTGRATARRMFACFSLWQKNHEMRADYRKNREKIVYSVSQSLPVVRDLYDVLFSANSVEESISMSTQALEKILPHFQVEIYVMVSNTMLRASVPLHHSSNGTTSRFSSQLFDQGDRRSSPMNIPPSPIYDQTRSDLSSPQGHVLSSSQTPWSTDKTPVANGRGGNLFHTPFEQRHQNHEQDSNAEVVSVIVGRGNVGTCAKTGSYQVNRHVTSSTTFPDNQKQHFDASLNSAHDDIASIVVPLISSGCIVGVLQLTPLRRQNPMKNSCELRPNSPVAFPYPSTAAAAMSFSYPFPNPAPHQASFGSYSLPQESMTVSRSPSTSHSSRFFKQSVAPLPPPQFTELVNMCMDVHISDISTVSQLCIVVGTLSDSLRMFIDGNVKKTDFTAEAMAEKEQLETYIAQLHGEVSNFEETVEKSTKRIEHLEKSRLKYFNESKTFKEKVEEYEKENEGLTEELSRCKSKLDKYLNKKRSEGVVMEKLHRSLSKATIEVFGTPAVSGESYNNDTDLSNYNSGDGAGMSMRDLGDRSNSFQRTSSANFDTGTNPNNSWVENTNGRRSMEDIGFASRGDMHHINTNTPSSRFGPPPAANTMNTATTHDSASNFSPALNRMQSQQSLQSFS